MSKIENSDINPHDAYPQYNWYNVFNGLPEEGWCKAYTFNDDGERIATSLYYGGINIYQMPVWKERTLPLIMWNNLVTHWAPLDQDTINQHPLVNDSDEDIDEWTTNNEWVNARPVGREFDAHEDLKNELDSLCVRRSHSMYNPFEYPGHDLNNPEDPDDYVSEPDINFTGDWWNDDDQNPTSLEWQACRMLINAGYRGYKACYRDQGNDYRLTPYTGFSLDVDATEGLELATGTANHLAQILTLENYIRDPDNLMTDLWKQSAAECNDPVKDEYGHGIDLIQLHDARYRTVINCCRILARQAEEAGDDTQMSHEEKFNAQCKEYVQKYADCEFDIEGEFFNPYDNIDQLASMVQIVSALTGKPFVFDQGEFWMSMIWYVETYATAEYII